MTQQIDDDVQFEIIDSNPQPLKMKHLVTFIACIVIFYSAMMVLISLSGCTYNVSMIHSDASNASTDTLEDQQTANPNIQPNLNIPVK
jgi:hypothetical protein